MSTPVETPAEVGARPLRADARRNRERVLKAARKCFAEEGKATQMDDVARRAGVGVGTVYRHFPDKSALVRAVVDYRFVKLADYAREQLEVDDPWQAFEDFIWHAAKVAVDDRALSELMAEDPTLGGGPSDETGLRPLTQALIERAQAAGELRPDFSGEDVGNIMCGIGRGLAGREGWERYVQLLLDGMRVEKRTPLPA